MPCEGLAGQTAPISVGQACGGRKSQGSSVCVSVCVFKNSGTRSGFSVTSSLEKLVPGTFGRQWSKGQSLGGVSQSQ